MPNMKALAHTVWDEKILKNFLLSLYVKSETPQHRTKYPLQDHNFKCFGRAALDHATCQNMNALALMVWDKKIFKLFNSVAMTTRVLNGIQFFVVF